MNQTPKTKPLVLAIIDGVTLVGALDEHTRQLENPAKLVRNYGQRPSQTVRGAFENVTSLACCAAYELVSLRGVQLDRGTKILSLDDDIIPGERREIVGAYESWMQSLGQLRAGYAGLQASGLVLIPGGGA